MCHQYRCPWVQGKVGALKLERAPRVHGLACAAVVGGLSGASVERMFSKATFTHRRLDAMREMELTDLLHVMAREGYRVTRMTFE